MSMRVAVIGAGMAGLTCATHLAEGGAQVAVFDKGRGPAGRMSTRRASVPFDHGAQYFTARDAAFQQQFASWVAQGLVAQWTPRVVAIEAIGAPPRASTDLPRYVGIPGMNAIAQDMASRLDVATGVTVTALERHGPAWRLRAAEDELAGDFDRVVITAPPPQALALLASHRLAREVAGAVMAPCWTVMTSWADAVDVPFDAAFVNDGPLSWIARDGSKPHRPHPHAWVLHASPAWSTAHLEDPPDTVLAALLHAFEAIVARPLPALAYSAAHRWRYALPTATLEAACLWDADSGVGVAGDWCGGPRVEGAWLSGRTLAQRILTDAT
jgi:renalase